MEELPEAYQRAILPAKRTMLWDAPDVELPTCDPSGADLVVWVLAPPDPWGARRRLLYTLVTIQVWSHVEKHWSTDKWRSAPNGRTLLDTLP